MSLIAAGLIVLLGPVPALVIPLLLAAGGTWVWQRRRARPSHVDTPTFWFRCYMATEHRARNAGYLHEHRSAGGY